MRPESTARTPRHPRPRSSQTRSGVRDAHPAPPKLLMSLSILPSAFCTAVSIRGWHGRRPKRRHPNPAFGDVDFKPFAQKQRIVAQESVGNLVYLGRSGLVCPEPGGREVGKPVSQEARPPPPRLAGTPTRPFSKMSSRPDVTSPSWECPCLRESPHARILDCDFLLLSCLVNLVLSPPGRPETMRREIAIFFFF